MIEEGSVEAQFQQKPGCAASLSYNTDEGPGLDGDIAPCAFEPFRRGSQTGLTEESGNGLGLSVVRAIVEAHGGKIRYAPSEKGGAMFEISLGQPVS
jgi:two-component system sensor histidine kinase AdeS